ncbi:non-ribosomal peptide synthetase [Streptomyces syringium]|uniref:non-ribosomal peptide synthetase n=1 Tax=Streptomyces syringium TaxID=76729 RepID=UPI0034518877
MSDSGHAPGSTPAPRDGILAPDEPSIALLAQRVAQTHAALAAGRPGLLAPGDLPLLLALGDGGTAPIPDRCLHELFEEQAGHTPNAVAVHCDGVELTYRDLARRAAQLSRMLPGPLAPGQPVGICLERSADLVAALLAVLTAGGCYVPLDPSLPPGRLRFIAEDAGLKLVLTSAASADRLEGIAVRAVLVDGDARGADDGPPVGGTQDGRRAPCPHDPAYVIYTSGSTGRPKGVVVEHRSAVDVLLRKIALGGLGPGSRMLGFASAAFDVSLLEIFGTLLSGATLVLATEEDRLDMGRLQALMVTQRVTAADLPVALLPLLDPEEFVGLGFLSTGGEAPPGAQLDRWAAPGRAVWNSYGPTETTVDVTMYRCTAPAGEMSPPIGRPMPNHRVYVTDPALRLLPPGAAGELCVAGAGLARGYLGAPALTAERFVDDPWGPPGSRLYRTGDLVRWNADGQLEFLGRADGQVKVHGHRIELGEIEAHLTRHPDVRQAAVTVRRDSAVPTLVGYVVPRNGADPAPAELRAHLGRSLPGYMVPHAYVTLDRLPLGPSGKLDRRALPAPGRAARTGGPVRTE